MGQLVVHKRPAKAKTTAIRTAFDDAMYVVALVAPILTVPQLLLVWTEHRTDGLSLLTWSAYTTMSGVCLIYGILQHQKQLILSQACLFVLDFGVVFGVCISR